MQHSESPNFAWADHLNLTVPKRLRLPVLQSLASLFIESERRVVRILKIARTVSPHDQRIFEHLLNRFLRHRTGRDSDQPLLL
jgi:hypothetical protein